MVVGKQVVLRNLHCYQEMVWVLTDPQFSEIACKPQTLVLIPLGKGTTGIDKAKLLIPGGGEDTAGGEGSGSRQGVIDGNVAKVF